MKAVQDFSQQVEQWLLSLNMPFAVELVSTDSFQIIEVKLDKQLRMVIRLIDLSTWIILQEKASEKLAAFSADQKEIREFGISVVTLWEDIWIQENAVAKSRLSAMLGISHRIPARTTAVRRIDKPTADKFLRENHLQKAVTSKVKYGLFLPNRYFRVLKADYQFNRAAPELLVAVATFSHARIFEREGKPFRSYELIRFANLLDTTVIGGLDKLLRFFEEDCKPDDIMTYADMEWSDGASYKRLGFEAVSDKAPIPFWLDKKTLKRTRRPEKMDNDNLIEVYNGGSRKFVREIFASFNTL